MHGGQRPRTLFDGVSDEHQHRAWTQRRDCRRVHLADHSGTDDGEAHQLLPLCVSPMFDRLVGQQAGESVVGRGEQLRAAEASHRARLRQVRFEREVSIETVAV